MNGMVDSRVVEMHFDNSDFMDKIEETIAALERLNDQISSINQTQGLMNLSAGADIGLSNVEDSLGNIEQRFSILGIVGMTIVQRLTNAAIDGVMKVKNALTAAARQTKEGGFIRASNIEQAKFLLEGLGADVEGVFKRVDTAVTGTAYGIDEAARAAASFYASGITNGDKLEHSLRAVAGVAAMTGSDFASIADIFTTVAGQGKVMTMQLRMMEGRGLNAAATIQKFFNGINDGSIQASESVTQAVKKLTNGTKVSEENVREFVNKGKIDFEMFSAAMDNAFGEHAQEANKTFSGSLANMKTALSRLGEAFITPGMQAAIPIFNRLRETISKLTNDLKSSKASKEIDRIVSTMEKAGTVLPGAIGYLDNVFNLKTHKALADYFNGVNDGSIKASNSIKKMIKDITDGAKVSEQDITNFAAHGKISFDIFNAAMGDTIKKAKDFHNVSSMVTATSNSLKEFGNSIAAAIKKFNESDVIVNVANAIYNSFRILKTILGVVKDAFKEVFPKSAISSMEKFTAKISENTEKAADWLLAWQNVKPIKNIIIGILSGFKAAFNIFSGFFGILKSGVLTLLGFSGALDGFSDSFRKSMERINEKTGTIGIFDKISKIIEGFSKITSKAFDKLAEGFGGLIRKIAEGLGDIEHLMQAFTAFGLLLSGLAAAKNYKIIKYRLGLLTKNFSFFIQMLRLKDLQDMGSGIRNIIDSTARALKGLTHEIEFKVVRNIALSVLALAVALKLLETVNASKLASGMGAVTVLFVEMTSVLLILMAALNKSSFTNSLKGIYALGSMTNALLKLAGAMLLMAVALKMIGEMDTAELAKGLIGISVMLGGVLAFILVLDKYQKVAVDKGIGLMILAVAGSLLIMAQAVQMIASLNVADLAKGLVSIVALMGAIFAFMFGISELGVGGSAGMIAAGVGMMAMATAINILAPALGKIGSLPLADIAKGLTAIIIALLAMAQVTLIADFEGAAGMFLLSLALASLATSLQRIGSMKVSEIAKGLLTLGIVIAGFGAAATILFAITPAMLELGLAMLALSGSVFLLGAGLTLIGTGLTTISAGLMSFAAVTVTSVEVLIESIKTAIILFVKAVPEMLKAVLDSFVQTIGILEQYYPMIFEAVGKLIAMFIDFLMTSIPKLIEVGVEFALQFIGGFLKGLTNNIKSIVNMAIDIVTQFINGIAANMDRIVQSGINLIVSFINGLANGIRNSKEDIRDAVFNLCEAILEAFMAFFGIASPSTVMEQQGEYLGEGLINGLSNIGPAVKDALVSMITSGFNSAKKAASKFTSVAKTIVRNIATGIKNAASNVTSALKTLITKGVTAVKNAVSKFVTAGLNLVKGIARGIRNGLSHVISAVGNIASRALKSFKSKLGISSPSKVFAEAGRWIPEGIVVGINKTAKKVYSSVSNMADTAVDAMSDAISKAYDTMDSDNDFNPTITPILDLSNIKKEAGGIESILGDQSVTAAYSTNDALNSMVSNRLLFDELGRFLNSMNDPSKQKDSSNIFNNYVTVDGAENPEDFANRFMRQLQIEMRSI